MEQENDRRPEILHFLQPYMEERFKESCSRIQEEIEKNGQTIWDELEKTINQLLFHVDAMQKDHKKNEIKYFVCSLLRYSLYFERPEFYIHAMDEGFYLDEQEAGIYYCPQFLQKSYLEDINYLHKKAAEKFIQLQNYELFDVNETYIKFYYSIIYKMMESVSELIMETVVKSGIFIADDLKIIYGEYMDNATVLYTKESGGNEILFDRNG